ncbi:MFS transporter [Nocardia alba]|uniref:Putative MFS family arabinose efflux permease n=1 Tax=Nocardia alba TaxID=225051 RepID=A0A4R1FU94_9NOCA|nr:MFS transporter [Nocardia alba]TCJ97354.1 putative MFS family arabinose efflux permease [Nocardia alba]
MGISAVDIDQRAISRAPRFHPAWTIVAAAALALAAAGSFATIAGLITEPLVETKGWSRTGIGAAVAVNMVLYGAVGPFAAAMMDRYGIRRVTAYALTALIASSVLTAICTPSVFWFVLWFGFAIGVGTGSITTVFAATVANRWFYRRIGLATGLLTAASVFGQFAMLPLLSVLLGRADWRAPVLTCGALAAAALFGVLLWLRESPATIGIVRYGADVDTEQAVTDRQVNAFARTTTALLRAVRDRRFWVLASMFALCGATTNGLMWSHFTPAAHDHGMAATAASGLLAIIGVANILGTVSAGWLSDRIDPRLLLAVFFLGRGVSLALLPILFTSGRSPDLVAFAVVFGVLDVATVPPTLTLCRRYFGVDSALTFGWISVFHQLGAGAMALTGGLIRDLNGSYTPLWIAAAFACLTAAVLGAVGARPR